MTKIETWELKCDECGTWSGEFGSTAGLQSRADEDEWKTGVFKDLCPECNPDTENDYTEVECSNCGYETQRPSGTSCSVCEEGELEKQ